MATYHFTLQVGGIDPEAGNLEERFYGGGIDDALIYVSDGAIFLAFDREAPNEGAAIDSAANDVHERGGEVLKVIRENGGELKRQASG